MRNPTIHSTLWRIGTAGLLAGGLLLGKPPQAALSQSPGPAVVYTFPAGSDPSSLLVDTHQDLWVGLASGNALVRLTAGPVETRVELTPAASRPFDLALGQDRSVWFTQQAANQLGRFSGTLEAFPRSTTPGSPTQLAAGQDGRIWFTEYIHNRLGWIKPDGTSGVIDLPTPNARPLGLAVDSAGNVWFTEWNASRLGKIDLQGNLSEVALPASPAHPAEIILGPDNAMWFTFDNAARVGRLDLITGAVAEYPLATVGNAALSDLILGADGRIWFISYQTMGSFKATSAGPADLTQVPLDSPVSDATGRSQILQGPGAEVYFTKANSQNLYAYPVTSADLRDLQVYIEEPPAQILASGPLDVTFSVYNASQASASNLTLRIGLPAEFTLKRAVPSVGSCNPAPTELVCTSLALAGNEEWTVQLSFAADQHAGPALQRLLTAEVSAGQADYLPANNRLQRDLTLVNAIYYKTGFTAGADSHWTPSTVTNPTGSNNILGPFSNDTVNLAFTDLIPHDEVQLCFDLYILGSWDGDQAESPDRWSYSLDGQPALSTTFSNRPGLSQAFPVSGSPAQTGAAKIADFNGDGLANDALYTRCATFPHSGAALNFSFSAAGLDAGEPETWALDNIHLRMNFHDALYYKIFLYISKG